MDGTRNQPLRPCRFRVSASGYVAQSTEFLTLGFIELAELQAVLSNSEPPGPALLRIARERQEALAQLLPAQRRVEELEEDCETYARQVQRLRARNAELLERERRRQGA